jgi:hypothetical protein
MDVKGRKTTALLLLLIVCSNSVPRSGTMEDHFIPVERTFIPLGQVQCWYNRVP